MVVTRFAPSPTGYLHIGGLRTALFSYLWAKKNGGKFVLRIEDTDKARNSQEATDAILKAFDWLGLEHDGEITYQSQRDDIYAKYIAQLEKELIDSGIDPALIKAATSDADRMIHEAGRRSEAFNQAMVCGLNRGN